ncbi:nucleoside hydrolase [Moorena bouillonii PNG]|uniref:Nucleoside hydrolase n=1 Tax=Moorena bouillonii PNG TaxID=568701 RepID=A0A1U7NBL8_9CYAN|nr:nucleoside hydrolase [Moorena bouillonii PNG]
METSGGSSRIPVLFDTDANNELDDQHALAYLFFNKDVFDIVGITVNATPSGGHLNEHFLEAERVMKLCDVYNKYPLKKGANANFEEIFPEIEKNSFDGKEAVDFIIEEARKTREQPLVLLPVGKLTNIALALAIAPDIKSKVRIVWLGGNYPEKGEYNLNSDIPSMNYVLEQDVPFEMVTVRYHKPSGTDAVRVTPDQIHQKMKGLGPKVGSVKGRHGGSFTRFGDYSISLFEHIDLFGDPPSRALFDMVAVAILKNSSWGEALEIPKPTMINGEWTESSEYSQKIIIWENFNKKAILNDFFHTMKNQ